MNKAHFPSLSNLPSSNPSAMGGKMIERVQRMIRRLEGLENDESNDVFENE